MDNFVSIIMPAYNSEKTIKEAIESVISQTYKNYELLIINNGSTDNTKEICEKYLSNRIKYYEIENSNVSDARNVGIKNCSGNYITFIDSDDEYCNDFLEKMINNIKDCDIITCGFIEKNSKREILLNQTDYNKVHETYNVKVYLETLKEKYLFNEVWNKLFKKDIIKNNNIKFNSKYDLGEDYLFVLDYIGHSNKVAYINESIYIYTDNINGLNLRYRKDKFDIEIYLTKMLEEFYIQKQFDLSYIYNRYGRIYYNGLLNIYSKNNHISNKEKDELLKVFLNKHKDELLNIKNKITDKKFNFLINKIMLKGFLKTKIFIKLIVFKKDLLN